MKELDVVKLVKDFNILPAGTPERTLTSDLPLRSRPD